MSQAPWASCLPRLAAALFSASVLLIGPLPGLGATPGTPDEMEASTAWLLDSPLRASLSAGGETALLWTNGLLGARDVSTSSIDLGTDSVSQGTDVRVNTPGEGEQAENCNTQNEVSIARHNDHVVAGWVDGGQCADRRTSSTGVSLSGYGYSRDGGITWEDGGVIQPELGGNLFGDPVLAADARGTFYYASIGTNGAGRSIIGVARSTDGGATWSTPVDASPGRGGSAFQDKPWLAVELHHSPKKRNVYVAWLEFVEGGRLGPDVARMLFSRSTDGGASFSQPIELPATPFCQPFNGAQVAVGPAGEVYVAWIGESVRLCILKSTDRGLTFTTPAQEFVRPTSMGHDQEVCLPGPVPRRVLDGDIRVEDWPSLAVDTSRSPHRGTIYVTFASRGRIDTTTEPNEVDEADVFWVYSRDGGRTWSGVSETLKPTKRLNDDDTFNDQFHPQVSVGPDGTVMVAWYDRRLSDDPLRENWEIDEFGAVSQDGGNTFGPNFRISDVSFPPSQTNPNSNGLGGCYMGEYNGLVADGRGEFLVAWGDNRDLAAGLPDPNVYFDRVSIS